MSIYTLDARRLLCPMPVIRTQEKIKTLQAGDTLIVTCTDPGAKQDIPAWCRVHGHKLVGIEQHEAEFIITVQVMAN
jgi:tRNA 2-thiouridine synthesizing protein A